jgi:hypothetical protein
MESQPSWLEKLWEEEAKAARAKRTARIADRWLQPLQRLQGDVGSDNVERITTQRVFDALQVPQPSRTTGAGRRLAKLMAELGWQAVQVRDGLTRGGYKSVVRGYCRIPRD